MWLYVSFKTRLEVCKFLDDLKERANTAKVVQDIYYIVFFKGEN